MRSAPEFHALGRFEVRIGGRPIDLGTPKQRAVLAVLLLEANRVVSTDRLSDLLWPDGDASTSALQSYLSNLRRALEPDRAPRQAPTTIVTEPPGYRLVADPITIDVGRFEARVAQATGEHQRGDITAARATVAAALAEWAGPLLPELAHEPFVIAEQRRLGGLHLSAVALAAQIELDLANPERAVHLLEGPVAEHALDERLHGLLALALYRSGRQADALRIIDRVRRALVDTTGLDIGPALQQLERDLLAHSPDLGAPLHPARSVPDRPSTPDHRIEPPAPRDVGERTSSLPLVGREAELRSLVSALDDAVAGHGAFAVVSGESGIGKTRLVEELTAIARSRDVVTGWTRCVDSGVMPAFWPIMELNEQARQGGATTSTFTAPDVAQPELDDPTAGASLYHLYRNVERALQATTRPLLLVIDDLQWADGDTLRLLAHLASGITSTRILVVVTVRSGEPGSDALDHCQAAFARSPTSLHLHLGGLDADATASWLAQRAETVDPSIVAIMHERTGGHPLFLKELTELLDLEGGFDDTAAARAERSIPPAVQVVVRRRVGKLPPATQQLLGTAAVAGRSFELDVVADAAGEPLDVALDLLAPALEAGIVVDAGAAGFRFSHALVAEALAAEINSARRARIHAAVATSLTQRAGPTLGRHAARIAYHALEGRLAGTAELAATAAEAAARAAGSSFGFEEAAAHWDRVLTARRALRPADPHGELAALLELAAARFSADLIRPAKDAAIEALELAEGLDDTGAMVRGAALLGHPHLWPNSAYGEVDRPAVRALRRIAARLEGADHGDRALVLGAMAWELVYADRDEFDDVVDEAVALARASGNPAVLAQVLVKGAGPLRPSQLDRRRALAEEVIELAEAHQLHDDAVIVGWFHLAVARWDAAQFDDALDALATCHRLVERFGGTTMRAQLALYDAATSIVRGRYEHAARSCAEGITLYRRTRRFDAEVVAIAPHLAIAADRGGLDQVLAQLEGLGGGGFDRITSCAYAWALSEALRPADAQRVLDATDLSTPFPDDFTALCGAAMALQVVAETGDRAVIETLMRQLEPYAGRWTQAGSGGCSAGLVDFTLARGAAALGDEARARSLFDAAVTGHDRLGAPAWLARSLVHQARYLTTGVSATRSGQDRDAARHAIARARTIVSEHGLDTLARQVEAAAAVVG